MEHFVFLVLNRKLKSTHSLRAFWLRKTVLIWFLDDSKGACGCGSLGWWRRKREWWGKKNYITHLQRNQPSFFFRSGGCWCWLCIKPLVSQYRECSPAFTPWPITLTPVSKFRLADGSHFPQGSGSHLRHPWHPDPSLQGLLVIFGLLTSGTDVCSNFLKFYFL